MELDAQLRQLLDRSEIIDRKHAYIRAADACDAERMVARFTEDCRISYTPDGPPLLGRETLREWYSTRLTSVVASSHHVSNFEFVFSDADTATMYCYLYSWQRFAQYPAVADRHRYARYIDTWVRHHDGWWQVSLTCLVAGEFSSDRPLRIGEYLDWDRELRG
ncbi:SnoaL-like protein [Jatrophihabitans sp. GAS493]|nr:SnoaL-like protein [Jatrophihabitans sp. GAS493]